MRTLEDILALEVGTVIMSLEEGSTFYYQLNDDEYWVSFGVPGSFHPEQIQRFSQGRWAVVQVPVVGS